MRKILLSLSFIFLSFLAPTTVLADYNSAYQDYVFNVQQYKNAHNTFQVAKSSYKTYGTLTAQNEAIARFKDVLKARNMVMSTYYDLIQEKLNATEGVEDSQKNTFNSIKESEQNWLNQNQSQIDAAGSIADLNKVSDEFTSRYTQMDTETKQAIGNILLAKEQVLKNKLLTQIGAFSGKLGELRTSGEDVQAAERGLISVQNKLDLQSQKVTAAKAVFDNTNQYSYNQRINLLNGQKALIEANQYLKESAAYLLELVRSMTG